MSSTDLMNKTTPRDRVTGEPVSARGVWTAFAASRVGYVALALILASAPGCAGLSFGAPQASVSDHTLALVGAPTSDTERQGREARETREDDGHINEKAVEGAFWTGVVAGSV